MKLLLTRHGQTDWNVQERIQGCTDIELNETGIEQAKIAREKLLDYDIDLIITSPLKRTKKTAQIINEKRSIPLIESDSLKERSFGKLEGKTRKEFDFGEVWNYKLNKNHEEIQGLESISELFGRVNNLLEEIKNEYQDKTVLLVTHGGVCVAIRAYLEGIPEGMEVLKGLGLDNCEVREYDI